MLKCWTDCDIGSVLAAIGLDLKDLFPARYERSPLRRGERWIPGDVILCLAREAMVIAVAGDDIAAGRPLSDIDRERVRSAAIRLRAAASEVSHERG